MSRDEEEFTEPAVAVLQRRVEELASAVGELRAELDAHRVALRGGLVTGRLAIVGSDGFERVVVVAEGDHGSVAVNGRSVGTDSAVELFANDVDGRAHVGVALTESGDVVSVWELLEGSTARLWVAPDRHDGESAR